MCFFINYFIKEKLSGEKLPLAAIIARVNKIRQQHLTVFVSRHFILNNDGKSITTISQPEQLNTLLQHETDDRLMRVYFEFFYE